VNQLAAKCIQRQESALGSLDHVSPLRSAIVEVLRLRSTVFAVGFLSGCFTVVFLFLFTLGE
jgi:hypothetical protein